VAGAAHAQATAPRYDEDARPEAPRYAYRAPHTRRKAAQRSRVMRTFVVFVGCLTLLAVGRVALSFAVVQKTLQTDAIVREQGHVSDKNAQLREQVAQLSSTPRIRHIAETQLGLVDAGSHVLYLQPLKGGTISEVAANR
jgi:cell division protein FtsB